MFPELGYYTCENKVFETKLEAMLYANPKNLPINWHFNDNIFNSYDWTIEPELSLDALYDRRAKEIREQYDYIILSYSGGSDSNNILESFLRQGLFIDEIVTKWPLDITEKYIVKDVNVTKAWNNTAEFYLHAADRLNYIKNKSPHTKITFLDTSKSIVDSLLDNTNADWIYKKNDKFNVAGAFSFNPLYFKEVRRRFDSLRNVAYIGGIDKPKMMIKNNKLYLYFIDKVAGLAPVREHIAEYEDITPVYFYWAPSTCDLLCKQAHTVYKHIKSNPTYKRVWESTHSNDIRIVQEQLLRDMIYTTWNKEWFQVEKATLDWHCELDEWFTEGWKGTKEHAIWLDGLNALTSQISNFIRYNNNGTINGTMPCFSKFHFIGLV